MGTFLFDDIIFGPVKSRRLGNSLGINLLPEGKKICNFNCIYCECGWNSLETKQLQWPIPKIVEEQLRIKLLTLAQSNTVVDTITFAGNGEPTMHPQFDTIVEKVIAVRDTLLPHAKIAVLSNATLIFKPSIRQALMKVDMNILKLDSAIEDTCRILNQPTGHFSIDETIENLKAFKGNCIIQTMFVRGIYNKQFFDNTTPTELEAWIKAIKEIGPSLVMIYTIERDTPAKNIEKISSHELRRIAAIAEKAGIRIYTSS
ncbi:MAG: radical SAM protein [Bacteroidales bacterium]|nr:radical SAM protein [Bacteroidales bacterium]